MNLLFYISSAVALAATFMTVTRRSAFHALLYVIVSLLAAALVFFSLGAVFAAVLEVIIYAGAIMVLFVFVVMMLNLGKEADRAREQVGIAAWIGPGILAAVLLAELIYVIAPGDGAGAAAAVEQAAVEQAAAAPGGAAGAVFGPREVALSLFGTYVIGVELASFILLAGIVGTFHLGTRARAEGGGS